MKLLRCWKNKKKNEKGFTLVELIVVLVILAILAAILVPALLGWIDKAKEKQYVLDARSVYMAAQCLASEKYAAEPDPVDVCKFTKTEGEEILKIADVADKIADDDVTAITIEWAGKTGHAAYTITGLFLTFKDGPTTCMLKDGTWTVGPDVGDPAENFAAGLTSSIGDATGTP